jgi:hypothetical protein
MTLKKIRIKHQRWDNKFHNKHNIDGLIKKIVKNKLV